MIPTRQTQAFLTGPGSVEIRELPMPEPGPGELLLRVDAATTCGTDVKVFRRGGHPTMLTLPTPFGHEVTGTVIQAGDGAARTEGDALVLRNSAPCGRCTPCQRQRENLCRDLAYLNGAFADHLLVPARFAARCTHRRPAGLPPAVAALAEPLACAVHCLERSLAGWGGPARKARALVVGSGPLGLLLTDLFASAGATVHVLDPHPCRLAAASTFGAAATHCGRAGEMDGEALGEFDIAVDATGSPAGWRLAVSRLAAGGAAALFGGCRSDATLTIDAETVHYREQTLLGIYHYRPASFRKALDLLSDAPDRYGRLIERELPLRRLPDALDLMIGRQALKVAIRPQP